MLLDSAAKSQTAATAIAAAGSFGYPYTPVLMHGKAMLSSDLSEAICSDRR